MQTDCKNFTLSDQQEESLILLREVLEYLRRLPPVPVTLDMCKKIQSHLAIPVNEQVLTGQKERRGSLTTPNGILQVEAVVRGNTLTLHIPALPSRFRIDLNGVSIPLTDKV